MPLHLQVLASLCAVCWLLSYGLIVRQARADRRVGMPLVPLCVNVSYEFIFGFIHPDIPPANYANQLWFCVDLVMVAQFLKYGRQEFTDLVHPRLFVPTFLGVLAASFAAILAITAEFNDYHGGNYTGWGAQLLVSASFIALLTRRRSSAGQSMYIALLRFVGSAVLIPAQHHLTPNSRLLPFLYVAFCVTDLVYMTLLYRQCRREGRDPWSLRAGPAPEAAPERAPQGLPSAAGPAAVAGYAEVGR